MAKATGRTISYRPTGSGEAAVYDTGRRTGSGSGRSKAGTSARSSRQENRRTAERQPARQQAAQKESGLDYSLIFVVLFMLVFGLVMLYSTSSYEAAVDYGDGAYYLKRQAIFIVIGLAAMTVVTYLPIKWWHQLYGLLYAASLGMLFLLIPFGTTVNGATRWIYIGPISIQPAEISKLAIIVLSAVWLSNISRAQLQTWKGFWLILLPAIVQAAAIYLISSNLSSALIVVLISAAMMFVTSEDFRRYILIALIVIVAAAVVVYMAIESGSEGGFRFQRILAWLDPTAYSDSTALQTIQGLYGIGSGGIFGKGLGQSIQKLGYVPEAQNDMIFSIICEELGLFGAISIIVLFLILAWRMMMIAMNARTLFESLVVVGVMSHIMIQVILNIAVVTNTIPNTGVTLPFFSYGGSAIFFLLIEIGLVLNVSRNSRSVG